MKETVESRLSEKPGTLTRKHEATSASETRAGNCAADSDAGNVNARRRTSSTWLLRRAQPPQCDQEHGNAAGSYDHSAKLAQSAAEIQTGVTLPS
eukprot:3762606-Rhodomonas_salina.4